MLWIALFIVGLLALLAGLVPLFLRGISRANVAAVTVGTVLLVAGAAGVVMKPALPLSMPHIALSEPVAKNREPAAPGIAPPLNETPAAEPETPKVRIVEPLDAPASSSKDESQLEPSALPDPVPVTTSVIPGGEPDPLANGAALPPASTPASTTTPAEEAAAVLGLLAPEQPKDQAAFTRAVGTARTNFDKADDAERESIQPERATAICKALPKPEVKGWVGKIQEIDADSGKRLTVTIALPDGTLVKTWNNAMSDIEDQTLVAAGSPLAQSFGKLKTGDAVRFSGSFFADEPDCYRSSRLSLNQSMMEPSFLFRFSAVEKL